MSGSIIFTDQHAPNGRVIHFNLDIPTTEAAVLYERAMANGTLIEIPNEDEGADPIYVNPDHVTTISPPSPRKED